jgi:hypothetical protein
VLSLAVPLTAWAAWSFLGRVTVYEAAALYRRALAHLGKALGKRHPKTAVCRANYACLLRERPALQTT